MTRLVLLFIAATATACVRPSSTVPGEREAAHRTTPELRAPAEPAARVDSCPDAQRALARSRLLVDDGALDSALGTLERVTQACTTPAILAERLRLRLALDDVPHAVQLAEALLASNPPEPLARQAREALARPEPTDSVARLRASVDAAEKAKDGGDEVNARRLRDRALHVLERLAGETAALDGFVPSYQFVWIGNRGYYQTRSLGGEDVRTVVLSLDPAAGSVEPQFAVKGAALAGTIEAEGERLLLQGSDGLLVYRSPTAAPQRLAGTWGRLLPGSNTIVTTTSDAIQLVDERGVVTKKLAVRHPIERMNSRLLDDGRSLVLWGKCVEEHMDGGECVLLLDLEAGKLRLDRAASDVALSPSGRYVGMLSTGLPKGATEGMPVWTVAVFDRRTDRLASETTLGPTISARGLQFEKSDRRIVIYEPGLAGVNTYTARKLVATVDTVTGRRGPAPSPSALSPQHPAERWAVVEPRLRGLVRAPRSLVPTARGPGRSLGFAETRDGRTIAVLAGLVEPAWAGVTTAEPEVLLIRAGRPTRRVPLPVETSAPFASVRLSLAPDDRTLWICLDRDPGEQFLVDLETTTLRRIAATNCHDWAFSDDGALGLDAQRVVELRTGREHRLPFAASADALDGADPSASWVHCRAGSIVVPAPICRTTPKLRHHGTSPPVSLRW